MALSLTLFIVVGVAVVAALAVIAVVVALARRDAGPKDAARTVEDPRSRR